jgi:hypothetical protein
MHKGELYSLYTAPNIIRVIKSKMRGETCIMQNENFGPEGKKRLGRPCRR